MLELYKEENGKFSLYASLSQIASLICFTLRQDTASQLDDKKCPDRKQRNRK